VCLRDHEWVVKSWDHNGLGVAKVHCLECIKDFGGSNGDHSKGAISNIFNNFHKSHVMSNGHIITFGIGVVGRVLISAIIHSPLPVKARLLL
jgi:hypothetical protein